MGESEGVGEGGEGGSRIGIDNEGVAVSKDGRIGMNW